MGEFGSRKERGEDLISQDAGISDAQFKEFRTTLEQALVRLESKAQSSRRWVIRCVVGIVICYAFALLLPLTGSSTTRLAGPAWMLCTWIVLVTSGVVVARYWYKHRPALERARTDLQIAMFGEIERQIAELSQRLEERTKP